MQIIERLPHEFQKKFMESLYAAWERSAWCVSQHNGLY